MFTLYRPASCFPYRSRLLSGHLAGRCLRMHLTRLRLRVTVKLATVAIRDLSPNRSTKSFSLWNPVRGTRGYFYRPKKEVNVSRKTQDQQTANPPEPREFLTFTETLDWNRKKIRNLDGSRYERSMIGDLAYARRAR